MPKRRTKPERKPATATTFKFGRSSRHPKAARTRRWEELVAFGKKHPRATLEDMIATTSYTRSRLGDRLGPRLAAQSLKPPGSSGESPGQVLGLFRQKGWTGARETARLEGQARDSPFA